MRRLFGHCADVVTYLDDICLFHQGWEEHLKRLQEVLQTLRRNGLTVRPSKVEIGCTTISFLGYVIGPQTLRTNKDIVQKIMNLSIPQTKKQVRSLLGLCSFYRRFLSNFAEVVKPLTNLTKKGSPQKVQWTKDCNTALEYIKMAFSSEPILKLPDMVKPFTLTTDASASGIGGCLLQEHDGMLHPVLYVSRQLLPAESRYSTIEQECLAVVWCITKLSRYLLGRSFTLRTDHSPLSYLNSRRSVNGRVARWGLILQDYAFTIEHVSGRMNAVADVLSRLPVGQPHGQS